MKKFILILLIVALLFGGAFLYVGKTVADEVARPFTREESRNNTNRLLTEAGFNETEFLAGHERQTISVPGEDGTLTIEYFPAKNSRGTILLLHPIGYDCRLTYLLAPRFLDIGLSVVTYDQRGAGNNINEDWTMGVKESRDLNLVAGYMKELIGGEPLYLWGVSTGASTIGMALENTGVGNKISGIILDSPIPNGEDLIKDRIRSSGIKIPVRLALKAGNFFAERQYGFSYQQADIRKGITKYYGRTLYFASRGDELVPFETSEEIFASIPGKDKKFIAAEDSRHGRIIVDHPALYAKEVGLFTLGEEEANIREAVDKILGEGASDTLEEKLDRGIDGLEERLRQSGIDPGELGNLDEEELRNLLESALHPSR